MAVHPGLFSKKPPSTPNTVRVEPILRALADVSTARRLGIFGLLTTSSNTRRGNVHNINSPHHGHKQRCTRLT